MVFEGDVVLEASWRAPLRNFDMLLVDSLWRAVCVAPQMLAPGLGGGSPPPPRTP